MKDLYKLIKVGKYEFPAKISADAKDLIQKMLVMEPNNRMTVPEVLNHPWVKEAGDETSEADETETQKSKSKADDQFKSDDIQGNINVINVDNIFNDARSKKYGTKLSYDDYVSISQDFYTY